MDKLASMLGAATLLIGAFISGRFRRFRVEGDSMLRAFKPGDRLIVESWTYRRHEPGIGDVVVVRQPGSKERKDLKRIIAGPGSHVTVRGDDVTLANDQWFVVGDNLSQSTDSRELGPVSKADIIGRVWFRY